MTGLRTSTIAAAALWLLAGCGGDSGTPHGMTADPASAAGAGAAGGGAGAASNGPQAGATASAGQPAPATAGAGGSAGMAGAQAMAGAGGGGGSGGAPAAGAAGSPGAAGTTAPPVETMPVLYWLDINANRVMRSLDFERGEAIVTRTGTAPDGVAVDVEGGKLYWSNMGSLFGTGGGSVQRANLDGSEVETIIPAGIAQTPKQLQLDLVNRQIYFCDREGAKVWRAEMDGSNPEAIVSEHGFEQLVGVAVDAAAGKFYFTDRNGQRILRANIEMPTGENGANRTDIEEMVVLGSGTMPIDLDIDHEHQLLYWTDRERGTVHRAGLEIPQGETASNRSDIETLVTGLRDTIGISLDVPNDRMYFTELSGRVSQSALDGSNLMRGILRSGSATGVAIAHVPLP